MGIFILFLLLSWFVSGLIVYRWNICLFRAVLFLWVALGTILIMLAK